MRIMEKTATGVDLDVDASRKVDRNFAAIDANGVESLRFVGFAGEDTWAQCGDSMAGFANVSAYSGVMACVRMLHYDYNFSIDNNRYYDAETEAVRPVGQRGLNFGKGQTTTQHMVDVQLPFILQALADGLDFSTIFIAALQNDRFASLADAQASVNRVLTVVDAMLTRGKKVFMLGVWPHTDLVNNGTANAYGKHHCERLLTLAAQSRPGFIYVPMLEVLKTGNATEEAAGKVNWRAGYSFDGIHQIEGGARALAPYLDPYIRRIATRRLVPTFEAVPFDETKNPLGNIFGGPGRFGGSGGTINGVTSANMPSGVEMTYDTTKGAVLTPRLLNDPDENFEIALSGTPSADVPIDFAVLTSTARFFPARPVRMWGQVRLIGVEGITGPAAGQGAFPFPIDVGMGSTNDALIAGSRTETITFSSMNAAGYGNEYGAAARMKVSGIAKAGATLKGVIRFRRLGLFATAS